MTIVESLTPRHGLRVLITAGANGIGLAIAKAFQEAGAKVHVCDIDTHALASLPKGISHTMADVSKEEDVNRLFQDTASLGGLTSSLITLASPGPLQGLMRSIMTPGPVLSTSISMVSTELHTERHRY